jgi:hypothetical protein
MNRPTDRHAFKNISFLQTCDSAKAIFDERQGDYADAFERMGLMGIACDVNGIAAKIQAMVYKYMQTGELNDERFRNALLDLHNYAALGLMLLLEHNVLGLEWSSLQQSLEAKEDSNANDDNPF